MRILLIGNDIHPPFSTMEGKFAEAIVRATPGVSASRLSICIGRLAGDGAGFAYVDGFRHLPMFLRRWLLGVRMIGALLRQVARGIEVFHFIWFAPRPVVWIATLVPRAFGRRVVFTLLSTDPDAQAFRWADAVTTASPAIAAALAAGGIASARVHVVPPPLLAPPGKPAAASAPTEPRFLLLSAPKTARQIPQRGLPLLFDAFAQLHAQGKEARLTIMGRWTEGHALIADLIRRRGLRNVDVRTEVVEDIFAEIRAVRGVFAVYSGRNAVDVPQSALEALACGRVVIASRGLGLESYLEGYPGLILTGTTAGEIAAAVERALAVNLTRCEAARKKFMAPFDLETFGGRISELYRSLTR